MNKNVFKMLKLALGLGIILAIIYGVGLKKIYDALIILEGRAIPVILLFFLSFMMISVYNIRIMLTPFKMIGFWKLARYFSLGWTSSLFLPGKAGDFSIAYFLKEEIKIGQSSAAIFMDKLITVSVAFLIAGVGVLYFFDLAVVLQMALAFLILLAVLGLLLSKKSRLFIRRYILRKHAAKLSGFSEAFFSYFHENRKYVLYNFLLTILKTVFTALFGYAIFRALGLQDDPKFIMAIILVTAVETITMLFPFTTNGLGIRQGVGVYLYNQVGIAPEIALARYAVGIIIKYAFGMGVLMLVKRE